MACLQPTESKSFKITNCIICQKSTKGAISSCTEHSVSKINECANNRCRYGDIEYSTLQNLLQDLPVEELLKQKAIYHRDCYQNLTSTVKTERAKKRFAQATTSKLVLPKKKGRPSTATSSESSATCGRLSRESYDRDKCILCQESSSVDLHEVTSENMGKQMREIGEKTKDESVKVRLSNLVASSDPLAAVAYDVKYHLPCLIKQKRQLEKVPGIAIQDRFGNILSDLEIVDAVSHDLQDERCVVLNMNDINTTYANILRENGCTVNDPPQYKKYLKHLILENIPDVHFNKPLQKNKSEQVLSPKTKETAVAMAIECSHTKEDIQVLMKAAQILRKEISDSPKWMFEGSFDNYTPPVILYTFCRQLIQGRKTIQTERKNAAIDNHSSILAQHVVQAFKSDRQVTYCSKNEATTFQSSTETPLSVGLALDIHKLTRSKRLVEKLHALDLSISYPKLMQIETGLARAVQKQSEINDGICIPSVLMKNEFMWFAIDNIDFLEATPSEMNTLHGTALAAFQSKIEGGEPITGQMVIDRTTAEGTLPEALSFRLSSCAAPVPSKHIIACELRENSIAPNLEYSNQTDLLWAIGCNQRSSDNGTKAPGTWSAFNSLISSSQTCTNVSLCAPLLRLPPTNYDALFTVLMRAQGINTQIMGPNKMCVVTVDLQLYDMVMKLWVEREDIREQLIFRPGELHTVFRSLTSLGKYIEGSGVDQAWIEAGLYSPTTVSKILTGKNMYRALDAHTVTLLALYQLYLGQLAIKNPDIGNSLKEIARSLGEAYENDINSSPQEIRSSLLEAISDPVQRESVKQIQDRLSEYESSPNKMQKFVMSYLKQFQTILLFVRATRQNDFRLHLAATESLLKYFFAHDHQNYGRLLSLYLASMQQTEQHHPEIWQEFMNGKFGISSGPVPFTTRSPDHGIEHENRKLKVIGGIVGLTQNDIALDRFFMIAPEMSRLCDEFENRYNVSMDAIRTKHHEIWGSKLHTTLLNAEKMKDVLVSHGNPFDESETELHTLLTNKVMTEKEANDILNRDTIGQQCFETFVHQRLNEGKICVWDRMSKVKLKTFKSSNVSKAISVGDKVIMVKEESSLLHRFIIAGRSRPELDLKECIGGYEFGIIPRSLFASDGTLLLPYDKAKVLHQLEVIGSKNTGETSHGDINSSNASPSDPASLRLIIIDGMAMVHTIKKTSTMLTCKDFAVAFTCKLIETVNPPLRENG